MRCKQILIGVLLLAGCSDGSTIEFTLRPQSGDLSGIAIEVVEGSRSRVLTTADFTRGSSASRRTPVMPVGDDGELQLIVTLGVDGQTIASGVSSMQLRSNFEWFVSVERQVEDPFDTCFGGCFGSSGFPIDPAFQTEPEEKLWVNWVGVERDSDIIF